MENEIHLSAEEKQEIVMKNLRAQWEEKTELVYDQQQNQDSFNYNSQLQRYEPGPREYLHNFLLQAKHAGCSVDSYIDTEIKKMLIELER